MQNTQLRSSAKFCLSLSIAVCFFSYNILAQQVVDNVSQLKFIGVYVVPNNKQFKGTTIGGLSGIDYDVKRNVYYLISDDRSKLNPARFYTAKIHFKKSGIDSVEFVDVTTLRGKDKNPYPNSSQDPYHTPDPEALRYNSKKDEMAWSSEGERKEKKGTIILEDPAITIINRNGYYKDSFTISANMHMHNEEKGPRRNSVFEGVSFADNFRNLYVSVEEPIYDDGLRAGTGDSTAWTRILKFNTQTNKQVAQYAYRLDAIPSPANPADTERINGISDILYIGSNKLLVLERAYSNGWLGCHVRVYQADLKGTSDISKIASLKNGPGNNKPLNKKLLLNFDSLGRYIDNVEGLTFGPTLPNGHRTMLFVVDDNFEKFEQMQFFLFEVIP